MAKKKYSFFFFFWSHYDKVDGGLEEETAHAPSSS